jgi:alkaline phosphatase D
MLGHVSATEARLWVRASGPAAMSVRVGQQPDLADGRLVPGPALEAASAHMGHAVVGGLKPSTRYHYCVWLEGRPAMSQPYPAFTTAPSEGQPGRVRFAFTSCVGYHGYESAPGFADMTRTNFDLLLMLGDNHYANTNDPGKQRRFYFDQRDTPGWRALSSRLPIYAIWDDHDYGPDNSDRRLKGKELSLQTFQEHWANPAYGEPDNPGVYFKFSRANVDFFLLDVRYHRDPNRATNLAHKTMLGSRQVNWLKRELLASRAPVKFLIAGGEWQSHGSDDSWTSFREERDDLFRFLEQERVEGVLLISGDRHFTGAYQVQGKWIEVTAGPIGSANATAKNTPEMFLNFSGGKPKLYCIYDVDTTVTPPAVTLEVYKTAEGLALRRPFTWDEVTGRTKIPALPPTAPAKTEAKPAAKPETKPPAKPAPKPEQTPEARPPTGATKVEKSKDI